MFTMSSCLKVVISIFMYGVPLYNCIKLHIYSYQKLMVWFDCESGKQTVYVNNLVFILTWIDSYEPVKSF